MSLILFWVAAAIIVYTYLVFPAILVVRKRIWHQPYKSADICPTVSMIIAAHNEAGRIGTKLANALSQDYPKSQLEVVVGSDGSTDDTEEIVRSFSPSGVRLVALPRQGKDAALNAAVGASSGELLVFTDANSIFDPGALRALVRPFADDRVGGVAGNQCYWEENSPAGCTGGERSYWDLDRMLKRAQSQAGNAISATGAIYAIRHSLFHPVPPNVTDDFAISTGVIAQGYRLVFAPDAIAREPAAGTNDVEFRRKVRIITRGLRGVLLRRELLNPFKYGFYAIQLLSHKVLRRLVVFPLVLLLLLIPSVWSEGLFYRAIAALQLAFYACGLTGMFFARTRLGQLKVFALPFFFCMVNAAVILATWNVVRGRRINTWEPERTEARTRAEVRS